MKIWQNMLLVLALLAGVVALAQPQPGGPKQGKPERQAPQAVTVTGTVNEVKVGVKEREHLVRVLLKTEAGPVAVGLGPEPYLAKIGLKLQQGDTVTVNGWKIARAEKAAIKARNLTLNGKTYTFCDEKGQPAWSPFEFLPQVTVQGTIKEIITPERPQKPAQGEQPKPNERQKGQPQQVPGLVLTTDKGDVRIIGVPAQIVEKLGLKLEVGMKVTVTGWQVEKDKVSGVMARTLTAGDKTITLRDAAGKPAWEKRDGAQKPEGNAGKRNGGQREGGQGGRKPGEGV